MDKKREEELKRPLGADIQIILVTLSVETDQLDFAEQARRCLFAMILVHVVCSKMHRYPAILTD